MGCCDKEEKKSCCPPKAEGDQTRESVEEYYGKVLKTTKDLKTSACTAAGRPPLIIRDAMKKVPNTVMEKFYGCGAPIPMGIKGLNILDLGSGSGRDCYLAAYFAGSEGAVIGVDMTAEQLEVSRAHVAEFSKTIGFEPNLKFLEGFIEKLPKEIPDNSQDLVISNCVVNLSPDKPAVLRESYRVLKEGGEMFFSDVYCDRRLPAAVRKHEVLWGECIAGALYIEDFVREAQKVGFLDPRMMDKSEIIISDPELAEICGNARFYSITYRLFKLPSLETKCEDYGQFAVYKGTIPGSSHNYKLDDHHVLVTNKPFLVCGNTAAMLGEEGKSWLSKHFEIHGDRSVHFGLFDCGGSPPPAPAAAECGPSGGGCC
eukprot:TRINITY_DN1213_c2_g1_i1.p1 TRINITY_DN1213_c2_g1~~TRINITY_DN1213_c2_g1_i1.p1  ORF type:complete len:397 (+),score=95.85 TRINITY_DN1213_c2_g1_i1:77-1192(+)